MDFDEYPLTDKDVAAVCRYAGMRKIIYAPGDSEQKRYIEMGYIEPHYPRFHGVHEEVDPDYLFPTEKCLSFADEKKRKDKTRKREDRRYWITTGIAIIALIVAILSLLQSVGLIGLKQYLNP